MMKKVVSRSSANWFLSLFLGVCLSLILLPTTALAEKSLSMEQVIVDAQVLPDASMLVTERITVDFSGQWNGFYIKIPQGDTPIKEVKVSENGQPYQFNPGTEYGPPGTYLIKVEGNQVLIDWSISVYDEVRTFDVSYRVINAVKIHSDTAELYRKFISEVNGNKIGNVEVYVTLPAGAEQYQQGKDLRIWGHGPLNGEVKFTDLNSVSWSVPNLDAYTFLEGRVLMPTALFPDAPREVYTGKAALASILSEEENWADKANQERLRAKVEYLVGAGIIVASLVGVFFLWRRYGRTHKTEFKGDYYRELPGNYSPAELSVLWNFNKMKAQDITATILDLARRKFLYLEEKTIEEHKLIGTKTTATYLLHFLPPPDAAALRNPEEAVLHPHEQELITFLQNDIGDGKEAIYLSDIEKYAKKYGESFYDFWNRWTSGIMARGAEYNFFDETGKRPLIQIVGGLGLFIPGSAILAQNGAGAIGVALIIAGSLFLFLPSFFKRRSQAGQEDYVRWQAFKKFLEHFSDMQRYEIPSLVIWEHYLVFAVTLGVAKEVIKQLELVFPNMQEGDYRFGSGWIAYGAYSNLNNLHHSFEGIGSSFDRALESAQKAVSKQSSGSGGGGGFSGGGGFGGGGSSYGGR